jgi:hypothetical protein
MRQTFSGHFFALFVNAHHSPGFDAKTGPQQENLYQDRPAIY